MNEIIVDDMIDYDREPETCTADNGTCDEDAITTVFGRPICGRHAGIFGVAKLTDYEMEPGTPSRVYGRDFPIPTRWTVAWRLSFNDGQDDRSGISSLLFDTEEKAVEFLPDIEEILWRSNVAHYSVIVVEMAAIPF